jgi:hypothetical protein
VNRRTLTAAQSEGARLASRRYSRNLRGVTLTSCLDKLDSLPSMGRTRVVSIDGVISAPKICFTTPELGAIVGVDHQTVRRWRTTGMLPKPVARGAVAYPTKGFTSTYESFQDVYLLEEVRAIVEVLGAHQRIVKFYRITDTDVTARLFEAVEQTRSKL